MKSTEKISCTVDSWIAEPELPSPASLKVIRRNDPDCGLTEDEIEDRNEFIRCYLLQEHELLMIIPKQDTEDEFFITDCDVNSPEYSAFNTVDFQIMEKPFNSYRYAMKKVMERVEETAIIHSCISSPDDRKAVHEKFKNFVFREFGLEHETLAMQLHLEASVTEKIKLKRKIAQLEQRIRQCQKIWERYAPPEIWDR